MRDVELLTITFVADCDYDPGSVGGLDYRIASDNIDRWIRKDPPARRALLAAELRDLAGKLERNESPFAHYGLPETAG